MVQQRAAEALVVVTGLGVILSSVGMMIVSGVGQGGALYNLSFSVFVSFAALFIAALAIYQPFNRTKQDQSRAETDSSLV